MSVASIYDALSASISDDGVIDLWTAAREQPALAPLTPVLALFGITSPYRLAGAAVVSTPGAAVLTGSGSFGVPGAAPANLAPVAATLRGSSPGGVDAFALTLALPAGWSFSATFPTLPPTQLHHEQSVVWADSFLVGLPLERAAFSAASGDATLHLAGSLAAAGALAPYEEIFAGYWPLALSGTVVLPAGPGDPPELELSAVAAGASIVAGPMTVTGAGLRLRTVTGLLPEESPYPAVSILDLAGTVLMGRAEQVVAVVSTPLLAASRTWRLLVEFPEEEEPKLLTLGPIADFFGVPPDQLTAPSAFVSFAGFRLSEVEVAVPAALASPDFDYLAVTLASSKEWDTYVPFVRVRDVGTRWVLGRATVGERKVTYVGGSVYGTVVVGGPQPPPARRLPALREQGPEPAALAEGNAFRLDLTAYLPSFVLEGRLLTDDRIPIGKGFLYFFGGEGPPTVEGMEITYFTFQADPLARTYHAVAEMTLDWPVQLGAGVTLTLRDLFFRIDVTQGAVTGGIAGTFTLAGGAPPGLPDPSFNVGAEYRGSAGDEGWVFTGRLNPDSEVELTALVSNFLGIEPPASLPTLSLERLSARFATGTEAYAVGGTVVGRWTVTLFGTELKFSATASADVARPAGAEQAAGRLEGRFAVNRLAVALGMDVGVEDPTYQFRVQFGDGWLAATTGWRVEGEAKHQVLSLQLGGVTLGGILEYLVNLAAPTLAYKLDPPWDVLNRIELSRFLLTVDAVESSVELTYRVDADLVFARVDTVGVCYRRVDGEGTVELVLTGRFLDRVYDSRRPLAWDVVRDPPPAVPGEGPSLVDLRYLGLGQRVALRDSASLQTVAETLARLEEDMQPPRPGKNPLGPGGSALRFAPDSQWLIGLDVSLLEDTVTLGLIFNDPRLYGLSVALGGERSGSLAGLRFEILYKKITDDIGMFRVELQLPEAFRHIELGEVSITLGVVVVEVYTNGNFLVDLGFPYGRDFGRSFTVQVFPFIGRGGIYFGVLNGATSRRVPAITNGTFAPVLELGVGLALGVGKDVTVGPLSGGIFVQVEVLFQGVLAWFNPSGSGTAPAKYYRAQAVAAIHGKLYGKVDFKVVKVSVTVEAYAQASVTLEAYRPTVFRLDVRVSAEAEVEIWFVSVSFSFHLQLDVSFTVGRERPTPWILAAGQGGGSTGGRLRSGALPALPRRAERRTEVLRAQHLADLLRAGALAPAFAPGAPAPSAYALRWDPWVPVFPDSPRGVPLTLLPAFSLAQVPVDWSGAQPPNPDPRYRAAFLAFADNGVAPGSGRAGAAARSADASLHARDTSELAADTLIEGLLRWSIAAATGAGSPPSETVTAGQLALLAEQMELPETADAAFGKDTLAAFFATNLHLQVSGDPGGAPEQVGGMAFPVPPPLRWSSPQAPARDFATYDAVGPLYEWGAAQYAAALFPLPAPAGPPPPDDPAAYESFAWYLFRDWCLMVAKAAVQATRDALAGWSYSVDYPVSLDDVAGSFPSVEVEHAVRAGDTVDSVAAALGATPAELEFLDPGLALRLAAAPVGSVIPVALGVTPQVVALDNATVPTAPGVPLPLGTVEYQAAQTDTLQGIAERFGLAGAAALFAGTRLAADERLLRAGAEFAAPRATWAPPADFAGVLPAATFYVRYFGRIGVPWADWYADTVFQLNAYGELDPVAYDQPIPAGLPLRVPASRVETGSPPGTEPYTTLPGDTLMRIGAALSLAQNYAVGPGPKDDEAWAAFRDAVVPVSGGVSVPASTVAVLPGESVAMLADRTLVHAGDVAGLLGWIGGAAILRPLAVVPVPEVQAGTGDGLPLLAIAQRYGLAVDDLAGRIRGVPGIFLVDSERPVRLTVAQLPLQSVDALVAAVLEGEAPGQISGMVSRQLLAGLRLPAPVADGEGHRSATGPLTTLYELSGQQVPSPAPDPEQPDAVALEVTVTADPNAGWVQLVDSATVGEEASARLLAEAAPAELNRALALPGRLRPGTVLRLGTADSLVFRYTNAQLAAAYPATGLAVDPARGPLPMPLAGEVPRTFGLDHRVEVQTPVPLPIPSAGAEPLSGNPTLWPFDAALRDRARAGDPTPFEVVAAAPRPDGATRADTVLDSTWATLLPFGVRRLAESDHVYGLRGADTVARAVLLQLMEYLGGSPPGGARAYLLVPPAPDARNPSGLALVDVDPAGTFLVQTNLATESVAPFPSPAPRAVPEAEEVGSPPGWGRHFAGIADLEPFARLLWEGSVVAGEGYWLGFAAAGGGGIPRGAFDAEGNATLYLLVAAGEQEGLAPEGRPLLPFNNCALVGPGLDASAQALFVEAADGSDPVKQALVPPGSVGFTLTLPQPPAQTSPPDAETQLRRLFSLATFQVKPAAPFAGSQPALPVGPQAEDGEHAPLPGRVRRERRARAARALELGIAPAALHAPAEEPLPAGYWRYDQVIPVYRLGPISYAPAVPGLPDPADDPYRGVGGQSTLPRVELSLGFADVLGNTTAPPSSGGAVAPAAGYTDPLQGVAGWPAVTASYAVASAGGGALLAVTVAPQAAATAPTPAQSAAATAEAALRQAEKYAQAYFQLAQPGMQAALLTSLSQDTHGAPVPLPVDAGPLWRFAAAGWAAARSAAALGPVLPARDAPLTLQAVSDGWRAGWAALAAANAGEPVYALFGAQPVRVPAYAVFAEGDTADRISATAPPGWPRPGGAALLALPENADVLPLRPAAVLATPRRQVAVPDEAPTPPLAAVAAGARTTAALLAGDNAFATGILEDGFVFEMDGLQVTVGVTLAGSPPVPVATFDEARQAFAEVGVNATVGDLAADNAARTGMLAPGAVLGSYHYVAGEDDTLAANGSTFSAAELAAANPGTADLFDAGALVYLGPFTPTPRVEPGSAETLEEFAGRWAIPPELLLAANPGLTLPAGSTLRVPGAASLPAGGARVYAPYTLQPGDTLEGVAARFAPAPGSGTPVQNLAAANQAMPGTMAPEKTITVQIQQGTASTVTRAGDSLASVLARLQAQVSAVALDDLVATIGSTAGYLAPGGLLVAPAARLPASGAGRNLAPQAIPPLYGVDAAAFAQANAGTAEVVAAGVRLTDPTGTVELTTVAHDTFNSLVAGFAAAGAQVDIAGIVSANSAVELLAAGALALLPPAPARVRAVLPALPGPFAAPVFPLTVAVRLQRPPDLVHPEFRTDDGSGPVERADTPVPAPPAEQGSGATASLTLNAFTAQLQSVFPTLRLATGKVEGAPADLWVVDFGSGGIARVDVGPGVEMPDGEGVWPRFFALRPLFNDLVTRRGVEVAELLPDGKLAPVGKPTDFQGVDVEVWARRFLADVDLFLTAPYAGAAYLDPAARTALARVLDAKDRLRPAVARGLASVLEMADPRAGPGLVEAARVLEQELGVSLSRAYDTAAVVQYDAAVSSAWTRPGSTLRPARLDGAAQEVPSGSPPLDSPPSEGRPFTLAGAKTALELASSFVTFVMRVSDPAHHGQVPVDLDYPLLYLEFDVAPVPGVEGYRSSRWVAFVEPLAGADLPAGVSTSLGAATVPVPLRAYPALPALLGQTAAPTHAGELHPTLEQTVRWTYALTYSHEHAAQDEVLVRARFNLAPPAETALLRAAPADVAAELAQYAAVSDPLWTLLAGFAEAARGVDPATLANAADTLAGLAERVAAAWALHWPPMVSGAAPAAGAEAAGSPPAEESYDFRVRLLTAVDTEGEPFVTALVLASDQAAPGPAGSWPDAYVRGPDGADVKLIPGEPVGGVRVYHAPQLPRIPAAQWPVVTLAWTELSVAEVQNARGSLSVRRNQKLLGETGPDTTAGFVYRTPWIDAADRVTPLNTWPQLLEITGADVAAALQAAFDELFGPGAALPVTVSMFYGYELVPPSAESEGLVTYLPVGLYPNQVLGPGTAAAIAGALADWQRSVQPSERAAEWAFALTLYSQLDPAATRPLLMLERMVYRIPYS